MSNSDFPPQSTFLPEKLNTLCIISFVIILRKSHLVFWALKHEVLQKQCLR